eukprot:2296543-Rhodomonas_salina.2
MSTRTRPAIASFSANVGRRYQDAIDGVVLVGIGHGRAQGVALDRERHQRRAQSKLSWQVADRVVCHTISEQLEAQRQTAGPTKCSSEQDRWVVIHASVSLVRLERLPISRGSATSRLWSSEMSVSIVKAPTHGSCCEVRTVSQGNEP